MSNWRRGLTHGVYESCLDPEIEIKSYCECGRNCMMRWSIYRNGESIPSEFYSHLSDAKKAADEMIKDRPDTLTTHTHKGTTCK
jgi:hypothetical protein